MIHEVRKFFSCALLNLLVIVGNKKDLREKSLSEKDVWPSSSDMYGNFISTWLICRFCFGDISKILRSIDELFSDAVHENYRISGLISSHRGNYAFVIRILLLGIGPNES